MENGSKTGVYRILNTANGKQYIGSTAMSFAKRWREHIRDLRRGTHHSVLLQRAWVKYGESSFVFSILLVTSRDEAMKHEQVFIDSSKSSDPNHGYNICRIAGSCLGCIRSDATKAKMSAARIGKAKSPEHRAALSASRLGKKHSPESIAKMAEAKLGKIATPEARSNMSLAGRGRVFSPEHRAKISAANLRRTPEENAANAAKHIGRRNTPEVRAKMSIAQRGKAISPEARERMSSNRGKKRSPEAMAKQLATKLRNKLARLPLGGSATTF